MKISVLKANKSKAENLWKVFQKMNSQMDSKIHGIEFIRKELTEDNNGSKVLKGSFEILYTKTVDGKKKERVIFRFLIHEIGKEIQWDEKCITM